MEFSIAFEKLSVYKLLLISKVLLGLNPLDLGNKKDTKAWEACWISVIFFPILKSLKAAYSCLSLPTTGVPCEAGVAEKVLKELGWTKALCRERVGNQTQCSRLESATLSYYAILALCTYSVFVMEQVKKEHFFQATYVNLM